MEKQLKLYVWEDVLTDYTPGIMFALAESPEEARELIREKCDYVGEELEQEPECYETPVGFAVWGGG